MANRYVRAVGGNWNAAGTWELTPGGGEAVVVPTSADDVYLVVGSGQLTINAAAACRSFNCTGYANTVTHNAFTLTIGDGTAPAGGIACLLAGTYTPNAAAHITFNSSAAGTHTVDFASKTLGASATITFSGSASYQFANGFTAYSIAHTAGTIDFNGKSVTITYSNASALGSTGNTARTLTFGASTITFSGNAGGITYSGSNLTISNNTATFVFTGTGGSITCIDTTNLNGTSIKIQGAAGTFTFNNTCTINKLIIDPTTTKTVSIAAGKTVTVSNLYCYPTAGQVTFTAGTISQASGTVNLYQVAACTTTFQGGATFKLKHNCDVTEANATLYGLTIESSDYYLDYDNGSDSLSPYTAYGFYKVAYTSASGTCPVIGETMTGSVNVQTAKVSFINEYEWSTGAGTMYFKNKTGAFTAETLTGGSGGGTCSIAADFSNAAWKTITGGPTVARVAPSDNILIAKSPAPTGIGQATWTDASKTVTIQALTSCAFGNNGSGVVRVTKASHNLYDGAVVTGSATTDYNNDYVISVISSSTFDLVGSTYVSDQTGTITPKFTLEICDCDSAWTLGGSTDIGTNSSTASCKEGTAARVFIFDASPKTSTLQVYFATGTLDCSKYQKLSFWFISNNTGTVTADTLYIALCDDVAGANPVDIFKIPAMSGTANRFMPYTLTRNGGGNCNASVKSIALYTDTAVTGLASNSYTFDNFFVTTTNGLNLQSLFSKNSAEQGGTEGWHPIQSIVGNTILIDNVYNTYASAGRGYATTGTTPETVNTYKRETIKLAIPSTSSASLHLTQDAGTQNRYISYKGGYSTTNGTCDGETFWDTLNCNGYLIGIQNAFSYVSRINPIRANYGIYIVSAYFEIIENIFSCSCAYLINANTVSGLIITSAIINNGSYGINFGSTDNSTINQSNIYSNLNYGIYIIYSPNNKLYSIVTKNNSSGGIFVDKVSLRLIDSTLYESTEFNSNIYDENDIWSFDHDNTTGNHWGFSDLVTINWQTTTYHASEAGSWKVAITSNTRTSYYPYKFKIAEVAVSSGTAVTVTCWVKKDHATHPQGRLIVYQDYKFVTDSDHYDPKTDDTDWEELSITFTPTRAGVVPVYVECWRTGATTPNIYCGSITVTQS